MVRWDKRIYFLTSYIGLLVMLEALGADSILPVDTTTRMPEKKLAFSFCRDRLGSFPEILFNIHACSKCLEYLLPDGSGQFHVNVRQGFAVLQSVKTGQLILPSADNRTVMKLVCDSLKREDCADWKGCCRMATKCCNRQLNVSAPSANRSSDSGTDSGGHLADSGGGSCPMTWDGFSCVDSTPAGQNAVVQCPSFIKNFRHSGSKSAASRHCWPNSSWYVNDVGLEWTNYTACQTTKDYQTIVTLKLAFKGVSLALLVPSIVIFLIFRELRSQLRIKIHINLFLSLALTALLSLLWEVIVSRNLLASERPDFFIRSHQITCKFLNIASRCVLMATFVWMFCEGFYLTWLMLLSFRRLSRTLGFYLFGWGIPVLFCVVYVIVRVTDKDDGQCWMSSAGRLEWLIDGPTVACMVINFLFLLAIMRVMIRQLRTHNEEHSTLRRSLRALVILIPLFGLQQFCIIYRPGPADSGFQVYEIASAAVINLQGAVVALIFCFFNGEVQGHLKDLCRRFQYKLTSHQTSRQSGSVTSLRSRPYRPSLASIDTLASVILAPVHLATVATTANSSNDGAGDCDNHDNTEGVS